MLMVCKWFQIGSYKTGTIQNDQEKERNNNGST
jgi:hypothetical protein